MLKVQSVLKWSAGTIKCSSWYSIVGIAKNVSDWVVMGKKNNVVTREENKIFA